MNVNLYVIEDYENKHRRRLEQNKPKQTQFQTKCTLCEFFLFFTFLCPNYNLAMQNWTVYHTSNSPLTWDGSNRILYVDDLEVAKDTQAQFSGSAEGLYIGAGKNLEPGSFFSGLIDDVRIYDRAVNTLRNRGACTLRHLRENVL